MTRSTKHLEHAGTSITSLCLMWWKNWKVFHRTSIISHLISLTMPFEIIWVLLGAVQNIGVSFSNTIPWAKCVLGVGTCILLPSSKQSISSLGIMLSLHEKSFKIVISASPIPTQLKVLYRLDKSGIYPSSFTIVRFWTKIESSNVLTLNVAIPDKVKKLS